MFLSWTLFRLPPLSHYPSQPPYLTTCSYPKPMNSSLFCLAPFIWLSSTASVSDYLFLSWTLEQQPLLSGSLSYYPPQPLYLTIGLSWTFEQPNHLFITSFSSLNGSLQGQPFQNVCLSLKLIKYNGLIKYWFTLNVNNEKQDPYPQIHKFSIGL